MRTITTSDNHIVMVSDEDFDYVSQFNWCTNSKDSVDRRANGKLSKMHHEIALRMGLKFKLIDHKDRNPYNNCRENLRVATKAQNGMNRGAQRNNIYSDYKGVSYDKKRQVWTAQITANKQTYNLGLFDTEREAALAYNVWALKLHGEFAYINEVK